MDWLEIAVSADAETSEAVAEALSRYVPNGVAIEQLARDIAPGSDWSPDGPLEPGVVVRGYLPLDAEAGTKRRQIEEALWHLRQIAPMREPTFRQIKQSDWESAWKEHYHVARVSGRFVIKPSWREYEPQSDEVVLELDPGMAFGTGLHPTTQMCLRAIEAHMPPGARALDLGAGSGILAIAAAKLGAASVLALDIDPLAVEVARENVARNGVAGIVRVEAGSLADLPKLGAGPKRPSENPPPRHQGTKKSLEILGVLVPWWSIRQPFQTGSKADPAEASTPTIFDFALVNILAKTIIQLCDEGLAQIISPAGVVAFAGLIDTQEDEVRGALARPGFAVIDRAQDKDWVGLVCRRE